MTETLEWSPVDAMDAAFGGQECDLIVGAGDVVRLSVHRWACDSDATDHRLFLDHCSGTTLDVGCGPGRLAGALAAREVHAVGIDVSAEAVRLARVRGAVALCKDVFGHVPGAGTWDHALLADGNIGIGGDPVRLLRRVADLVHPGGTVLAEVDPPGGGLVHDRVRLRVGERVSAPFPWAFVGADAIGTVAHAAGLAVRGLRQLAGRRVAVLGHHRTE
ncbi:MAG: class I SAM-dependent methyltransferase [Nocardioidaceae bacterium]